MRGRKLGKQRGFRITLVEGLERESNRKGRHQVKEEIGREEKIKTKDSRSWNKRITQKEGIENLKIQGRNGKRENNLSKKGDEGKTCSVG